MSMTSDREIGELKTHIVYIKDKVDLIEKMFNTCPKGEINKKIINWHSKLIFLLFSLFIVTTGWIVVKGI